MRKISNTVCGRFVRMQKACQGNTMSDGKSLFLHGNRIAWWEDGALHLTLAGWNTNTTRERLNAVLTMIGDNRLFCKWNGAAFFGGARIGDEDIVKIDGMRHLASISFE